MTLPLLVDAQTLKSHLDDPELLIVDLSKPETFEESHIPGAIHVDPLELILGEKPAPGLLPPMEKLNGLFSRLGLNPNKQVVCYDDQGGPWAGRFIWTLDGIGHSRASYLNGGIDAWQRAGYELSTKITTPVPGNTNYSFSNKVNITADELMGVLGDKDLCVWDARSAQEYSGEKSLAARGGHIPGAIHCEWTNLHDDNKQLRSDLQAYLQSQGITADKNIITHCQTHRRSGLTYLAARILNYPRVRAYAGSWSEWGNREDTPIESDY